jgi:separase
VCDAHNWLLAADNSNEDNSQVKAEAETEKKGIGVRYELNPTGDMLGSEKRFAALVEQRGWQGRVRSCCVQQGVGLVSLPSTKESCAFLRGLWSAGVFVFVGHGTGERLLGRHVLYDARHHRAEPCGGGQPDKRRGAPTVLLMGCSSAKTVAGPSHDPWGMPLAYLHAGSPAVAGCLWDVTDGEVDKVTLAMIAAFLPPPGHRGHGRSLPTAVAAARHSCKFFYLTGGAVVVYGVPVRATRGETGHT